MKHVPGYLLPRGIGAGIEKGEAGGFVPFNKRGASTRGRGRGRGKRRGGGDPLRKFGG